MHAWFNLLLRISDIDNNIACLVLGINYRTYCFYFALENSPRIGAEFKIHFPAHFHFSYFTLQDLGMDSDPVYVDESKKLPAACYMLLRRNLDIMNYT